MRWGSLTGRARVWTTYLVTAGASVLSIATSDCGDELKAVETEKSIHFAAGESIKMLRVRFSGSLFLWSPDEVQVGDRRSSMSGSGTAGAGGTPIRDDRELTSSDFCDGQLDAYVTWTRDDLPEGACLLTAGLPSRDVLISLSRDDPSGPLDVTIRGRAQQYYCPSEHPDDLFVSLETVGR